MNNKLLRKVLAVVAMLILPTTASAYNFMVDGIAYNYLNGPDGGEVEVTYIVSNDANYSDMYSAIIPDSVIYNGKRYFVKAIGAWAFYNSQVLSYVTIPNTVTSIGESAFQQCWNLRSLSIPNSVTELGNNFIYATSVSSITIPASVISMGRLGCNQLNKIIVESGNQYYDSRENCNALIETATNKLIQGCNNTVIPNSVTTIGDYAFYALQRLYEINIPSSVSTIEEDAFYDCVGLSRVNINELSKWCEIDFKDCYSNPLNRAHHLYLNGEEIKDLFIPESVVEIKPLAFAECYGLTSVIIGNSVTSIGGSAFSNCSGLTSVTIGNSVISIGNYAFDGCSGLTSLEIPNSVTSICSYAFQGCSGLASITIGNSVTSIWDSAFSGCSGLTSVTIPNSVTEIGSSAFSGCSGITSVTIPNSVTSIGYGAFWGCSGLEVINSKILNPREITMGSNVFNGVPANTKLKVPAGARSAYNRNPWYIFNIVESLWKSDTIGDLNEDNVVNGEDVNIMVGQIIRQTRYDDDDGAADLNGDGVVNGIDLHLMISIILGQ